VEGGEQWPHEPLDDFFERLADSSPAPGGGSAAAAAVAMAAALVQSVASQSAADWADAGGVAAQAHAIRIRTVPLIELDALRYAEALLVLADRESIEAGERDAQLGTALEGAAAPLLQIGEGAADVAELAALATARGAHAVRADALAAARLADAAGTIAAGLLEINLAVREGDPRIARADELAGRASRAREAAQAAISG
jgi:formiminotetrahydrofolate cyclodeaminase